MGRRQYRQDLISAIDQPPPFVDRIETTDDGEISFRFSFIRHGLNENADLQLLALNVDDYPTGNEYMIFARDGAVDPTIVNAFEFLCPLLQNRTLQVALAEISNGLHQAVTSGEATNPIVLGQSSDVEDSDVGSERDAEEEMQEESAEEWVDDDDDAFGFDDQKSRPVAIGRNAVSYSDLNNLAKIKADLRQVKEAGFKVGVLGDLTTSGIICVSVRVSKLGISEEVMRAWGVEPQQYFTLLIRFLHGYCAMDRLQEESTLSGSSEVRVGLCASYKPNVKSAYDAFSETTSAPMNGSQDHTPTNFDDFQPLFIGRPLNDLIRSRFTRIVNFREVYCMSWSGAEQLVHDTQGAMIDHENMDKYDKMYDDTDRALPPIVLADTMLDQRLKHCSFPLVVMQFALRHFVRCTEFCLVCHCSSESTFEALKPYVCSSPLCLYQYMGLGFGPSIEWEILSQPYVVDLLISFCYTQALAGRLKNFPIGIDLLVPALPKDVLATHQPYHLHGLATQQTSSKHAPEIQNSFSVRYHGQKRELLFDNAEAAQKHKLKTGDFIALKVPTFFEGTIYHRIDEVMLPSVRLDPGILTTDSTKNDTTSTLKTLPDSFVKVEVYPFNNNFDDMPDTQKAKSILCLLETIPPVKEMQQRLMTHSIGQDSLLRHWRDRISPAALNVLRWIIASNRSCIMQVDTILADNTAKTSGGGAKSSVGAAKTALSIEDRVSGMDEYMQFRFAQGAPDKEQRFIDCVKKHAASSAHPTIFAWHGSPLANWHSIIREGLHFKETMHGRAYGHGVYMSPYASTSIGYTHMQVAAGRSWPNSELKITAAMSLNEVVNNPTKFVSRSPHLVVADTDWIQTRYLLVKTSAAHSKAQQAGMVSIPQDPTLTAMNVAGQAVDVPVTAVSKSRRPVQPGTKKDSKKRKSVGSGCAEEPIQLIDSDDESVATMDEDREYLIDDESHSGQTPIELDSDTDIAMSDVDFEYVTSPKKKARHTEPERALQLIGGQLIDISKTDFVPGQLDMSNIQILPAPDDASRSASSSLLKAFNALLKTQRTTAAHELGWYINPDQIENMYQWIVELHSFDADLPLAQDMKAAGLTSVVLEMRFTNSWPFAPPFVRVVKPRFLPFSQRGGGHVTEGGAICMELLTNNGWSAVSSIESVLLQVRLAMSDREPPARLASGSRHGHSRNGVYGVGEAIVAYERACRNHGWIMPDAFKMFQGTL